MDNLDDLYTLTTNVVTKHGGTTPLQSNGRRLTQISLGHGLLDVYEGSLFKVLQGVYPTHQWHPWKLHSSPRQWENADFQRRYLDWLGRDVLKLSSAQSTNNIDLEGWYNVSYQDIIGSYGTQPKSVEGFFFKKGSSGLTFLG